MSLTRVSNGDCDRPSARLARSRAATAPRIRDVLAAMASCHPAGSWPVAMAASNRLTESHSDHVRAASAAVWTADVQRTGSGNPGAARSTMESGRSLRKCSSTPGRWWRSCPGGRHSWTRASCDAGVGRPRSRAAVSRQATAPGPQSNKAAPSRVANGSAAVSIANASTTYVDSKRAAQRPDATYQSICGTDNPARRACSRERQPDCLRASDSTSSTTAMPGPSVPSLRGATRSCPAGDGPSAVHTRTALILARTCCVPGVAHVLAKINGEVGRERWVRPEGRVGRSARSGEPWLPEGLRNARRVGLRPLGDAAPVGPQAHPVRRWRAERRRQGLGRVRRPVGAHVPGRVRGGPAQPGPADPVRGPQRARRRAGRADVQRLARPRGAHARQRHPAVHRRRSPAGARVRPAGRQLRDRARVHQPADRARPRRHPAGRARAHRRRPARGGGRARGVQPRADRAVPGRRGRRRRRAGRARDHRHRARAPARRQPGRPR